MFATIQDSFGDLMHRGGWVMWPLFVLSLVGMTLTIERCWFWLRTNRPGRVAWLDRLSQLLRRSDRSGAHALVEANRSVYGRVVGHLLDEQLSAATAAELIEAQRPRLERFMPTLSTIITAAPMLGILGTVFGIISSFQVLSDSMTATDPRAVSQGIAEALVTTAAGLVVAIVVLFPYNAFRAQIDRTLGRLETLAVAAHQCAALEADATSRAAPDAASGRAVPDGSDAPSPTKIVSRQGR